MKCYFKNMLWIVGIFYCFSGTLQAMEIENSDENTKNLTHKFEKLNIEESHDLIYKLLTLKAEYLGEELHQEIEKIKPYIYEKIKEEDIKEFIKNYENKLTDEQRSWPEKLKCTIYFDKDNKIDSRTLLIGEAYFPKEYFYPPCLMYSLGKISYIHDQLVYAYHCGHKQAFSMLINSVSFVCNDFALPTLEEIPPVFREEHCFNKNYQEYSIKLPVKALFWRKEYLNFNSIDELIAYLNDIAIKVEKCQ